MKRLGLIFLLSGCGLAGHQLAPRMPSLPTKAADLVFAKDMTQGEAEENVYLVTFRSEDQSSSALHFSSFFDEYAYHYSLLDHAVRDSRVEDFDILAAQDISPVPETSWSASFDGPKPLLLPLEGTSSTSPTRSLSPAFVAQIARVRFRDEAAAEETIKEWYDEGRVMWAEPNYTSVLTQAVDGSAQLDTAITNYKASEESPQAVTFHLKMIHVREALETLAKKSADIKNAMYSEDSPIIAVMDSGVDYEHEGLKNQMWKNAAPGSSGCVEDNYGCDVTKAKKGVLGNGDIFPFKTPGPNQACPNGDGNAPDSNCQHGTHVAGIIAAQWRSADKPAGVCPMCRIMGLKVVRNVNGKGQVPDDAQISAMKYLSLFVKDGRNAVRVVNASLGRFNRSRTLAMLVSSLRSLGSGTLLISAAGNEDSMIRTYPSSLPEAVAVSSVAKNMRKSRFSNFGMWVDVAAPGGNATSDDGIYSTLPGGVDGYKSGTSMASPVVAGVAGLMLASDPNISFDVLRSVLIRSADPNALYDSEANPDNYQNYYAKIKDESVRRPLLGSGLVDANQAVQLVLTNAYASSNIDRVGPGCGVLRRLSSEQDFSVLLAFFCAVPLLVIGFCGRLHSGGQER